MASTPSTSTQGVSIQEAVIDCADPSGAFMALMRGCLGNDGTP